MRFFVTGASGFIGSRLMRLLAERYGKSCVQGLVLPDPRHHKEKQRQEALINEGFDLLPFDLLNLPSDFSKKIKPFNILFHLAAFGETESKNTEMNRINDTGTQLLLDALCSRLGGAKVVFTSSLAAVDRSFADNTPQSESYPCSPRTEYGISKIKAESILKSHAGKNGYDYVIARLTTVIGHGYRPGGLVDAIGDQLRSNKLFARLNWPGRIELVDVDDVAEVLIKLATESIPVNRIYHVSSGIKPSLDKLVAEVSQFLKIPRNRIAMPTFFWKFITWVIWLPGLTKMLPFELQVVVWRLSLIVSDGFVADGTLVSRTISPQSYRSLSEMLRRAYEENLKGESVVS